MEWHFGVRGTDSQLLKKFLISPRRGPSWQRIWTEIATTMRKRDIKMKELVISFKPGLKSRDQSSAPTPPPLDEHLLHGTYIAPQMHSQWWFWCHWEQTSNFALTLGGYTFALFWHTEIAGKRFLSLLPNKFMNRKYCLTFASALIIRPFYSISQFSKCFIFFKISFFFTVGTIHLILRTFNPFGFNGY